MIARAILAEHRYRPIQGEGLLIGRQTMPFSVFEALQMLRDESVEVRPNIDPRASSLLDTTTRYGAGKGQISDVGFFSLFCDTRFRALDVTDYEGAEIVHDMHMPIPDELVETVDFMWNGSCLDNMFDPATAMRNTVRMLKPGGRVLLMEIGTPHHNAYTMYSPAFFFDYFAINNFADCKVYVCLFEPEHIHSGPFDMFVWKRYEATLGQFPLSLFPPNLAVVNYVVAEKGLNSTWEKTPVQGQYRPDQAPFREAFARFAASPRPVLRRGPSESAGSKFSAVIEQTHPDIEYVGYL
jgi:SAM-dependent methyltransferase